MMNNWKAYVAEFVGTFTLVFIGCASVWFISVAPNYGGGTIVPAFAHGLAIVFAAYSIGHISGAHINPAVTIAVAIAGGIDWVKAIIYIVVQIVAAIVAAFLLNALLVAQNNVVPATQFGAFTYNPTYVMSMGALGLEAIATFFLAFVVCMGAVYGKAGNLAGLAIGLTLTLSILGIGGMTGASLNPARSLGPAIVAGNLSEIWIYIIGPILGGAVAAFVARFVLNPVEPPPTPPAKSTGRRTS
jgi:MIP family channel proteins